mmetsp:Transcript_26362/g.68201  ORF Transcript_26362/g.68201 Transcript_26362/m.68201 type:complete len:282 (+) Transcript_26362:265-1110(+)
MSSMSYEVAKTGVPSSHRLGKVGLLVPVGRLNERLAVRAQEVQRDVRLTQHALHLLARDLLRDERAHRGRQLEAVAGETVAGPQPLQVRLADHRVHVVLVHGVHAGEAHDLARGVQTREAVKQRVEVLLLKVGVQVGVVVIGVHDLRLETVVHRAEDQLVVGAARHEVDTGRSPGVGGEGQIAVVIGDVLVADLDARGQRSGGQLEADGVVELVKPGPRGVHGGARMDLAAVCHAHALHRAAFLNEGRHLLLHADVGTAAARGAVDILQAEGGVQVAAADL